MHEPLTDEQVRGALAPGEPGDDLIMATVEALRASGRDVEVEEAGGTGPRTAYVVVHTGGRRMRLTAEPW